MLRLAARPAAHEAQKRWRYGFVVPPSSNGLLCVALEIRQIGHNNTALMHGANPHEDGRLLLPALAVLCERCSCVNILDEERTMASFLMGHTPLIVTA